MSPLTPDERAEGTVVRAHRALDAYGVPALGSLESRIAKLANERDALAERLEAEPEPDPRLQERVADMLAENDAAGPGPVSRREYLDDAAAILRLVGETPAISAETIICCDEAKVATPGCDHVHGLETLGELIDAYSNPRVVERERDEAREALRELVAAIDGSAGVRDEITDARTCDALTQSRAVLEGVERTHTLVPVAALREASTACLALAREGGEHYGLLCDALNAAARGEHVEWPS